MREINLEKLIEWLGPDGAITGLDGSNITVSELCQIAASSGLKVDRGTRRHDIIVDLVNRNSVRIEKTTAELLSMSSSELYTYFMARRVSKTELLNLLSVFDIRPAPGDKVKLTEFAAREISDVGMYQRVASGARRA